MFYVKKDILYSKGCDQRTKDEYPYSNSSLGCIRTGKKLINFHNWALYHGWQIILFVAENGIVNNVAIILLTENHPLLFYVSCPDAMYCWKATLENEVS